MKSPKLAGRALVWLPAGSTFFVDWVQSIMLHGQWDWRQFNVCYMYSVWVANNIVHLQSAALYGYYAFGEVAHFVYCLLQKIKKNSALPIIGAVGGVYGSQSFDFCSPSGRSFSFCYASAVNSWESGEILLKNGSQAGLLELSWRPCELCFVNCCREVLGRPRVELFPPAYFG